MSLLDDGEELQLTVNESFAKKYEGKKKKEELSILKDKYKIEDDRRAQKLSDLRRKYGNDVTLGDLENDENAGSDSDSDDSTSEEEDDVGELVTPEIDVQILKTLALIRKKDDSVYVPEKQFFTGAELEEAQKQWKIKQAELKQRGKKLTLKDVERQQLLSGIADMEAAEEEDLQKVGREMTHVEEQNRLKEEFKAAMNNAAEDQEGEDGDDALFVTKEKTAEDLEQEEADYKAFLLESMAKSGHGDLLSVLRDGPETGKQSDPNEQFLLDYILNRGWIEKDDKQARPPLWADENHPATAAVENDDEDEALDEAVDGFERKYNFRFEELNADGGEVGVQTYARDAGNSVRRKDDKRKRLRDAKKARKDAERQQKEEELKRLKNLKREQILAKLREISEITGNRQVGFDEVDLEADFDPEAWDQKMNAVFDDQFYNEEGEAGEGEDLVKPEWEDDIDISYIGDVEAATSQGSNSNASKTTVVAADEDSAAAAQSSKKKKNKKRKKDEEDDDFIEIPDADLLDPEEVPNPKGSVAATAGRHPTKGLSSKDKAAGIEELDALYKLDFEDIVGGIPTRFSYRQVRPTTYGLSVEEILEADDAIMNQFVPLKKLAPYRKPDVEDRDIKKLSAKHRVRQFRKALEDARFGKQASKQNANHSAGGTLQGGSGDNAHNASHNKASFATPGEDRMSAYQLQTKKKNNPHKQSRR